jgi:hypothetical protein
MKLRFVPLTRTYAIVALAGILALLFAACAQDVKITAPRYALVFGVQDYLYARDLQYTLADATSMSTLLSAQGWQVTLATDTGATRAKIIAAIAALGSVESDSTVLIYFSGHGDTSSDYSTSYLCPSDTNFATDDTVDTSTEISASQLSTMLDALPTSNVIVLLDCCFSGGSIDPGSAVDASPQDYYSMQSYSAFSTAMSQFGSLLVSNSKDSGKKAPIVISAAGSEEESYDGPDGTNNNGQSPVTTNTSINMSHGIFTYYLLKAQDKGDSNGDGVVTTTEAFAYSCEQIQAWDENLTWEDVNYYGYYPFLPHISGGVRDLVLFTN